MKFKKEKDVIGKHLCVGDIMKVIKDYRKANNLEDMDETTKQSMTQKAEQLVNMNFQQRRSNYHKLEKKILIPIPISDKATAILGAIEASRFNIMKQMGEIE